MTPNGTPPAPTAPVSYNAVWCNERHARIDSELQERKEMDKELLDRMGKLEARVAKIMGGIGVLLVVIEVVAKLLWGGG